MNKIIFFLTYSLLASSMIFAHAQNRIDEIDQEIVQLQHELSVLRKESMKDEINAQNYMRYEWQTYTKDIEHVESEDKKIYAIKQKIGELEREKMNLLNTPR